MKDEEEMNNYLNKGIYPLSLQTSIHTPELIPKLDDIKTPIPITPIKIDYSYQKSLINKVTNLENAVRETLMRENKENDCPICLETIPITEHDTFHIQSCCGGGICSSCIKEMISTNTVEARRAMRTCPLCRGSFPT